MLSFMLFLFFFCFFFPLSFEDSLSSAFVIDIQSMNGRSLFFQRTHTRQLKLLHSFRTLLNHVDVILADLVSVHVQEQNSVTYKVFLSFQPK